MRDSSRYLLGVAIAVLGLTAGALFWDRAFPTAALQFSITESTAEAKSRAFLKSAGYDVAGYLAASQFGEDGEEKNYVEKEYGVRALETKVRDGINLWYWTTRFFKPEQEEEFSIAYDPQGRFVGISHSIPEKAAAPLITREQARVLAEDFLKQNVPHHPFAKLKLIEDSSKKRPHRTDYYFTWEQDDLRLGDATYQLHVTIQGNKVGGYNENVKVPELWLRNFRTQRSTNSLFQQFAEFASIPIGLGAVVLFVLYVKRRQIRWRSAIPLRWLILFGLVEIAATWNNIPDILSAYRTTEKWGSFVLSSVNENLIAVIASVTGMYLLSVIADAIYRDQCPDKLPFSKALGRNSLYQPEVVRALGVGIVLACFGIGYVSTFYVVASHFGAWSPVDIDYSKIIGGPIPWISGIQVGISAAWTEEFLFRVVGILLYWKLLRGRWKWAGIILAGATWAFLHSNYPQMPGYLRGCELTAEGILWGVLLVRYGIVSTLTGHYLYDCWLGSMIVFQSADPLNKLGAVIVSLWPVALWLIGLYYLRTGQKPPVTQDELDAAYAADHNEPAPLPVWSFQRLSFNWPQRVLLVITAVLTFTVIEVTEPPVDPMDDFGDITLSRQQIAQAADKILLDHGQNPATFRRLITLSSSSTSDKYLLEHGTPDEVAYLFESEWTDLTWHIRYFRFRQKEEFNLTLNKDGKLINWRHAVPREATGESLEKAAALTLAQKHLEEKYDIDFKNEKLVEDDLTQQVHRRDYAFTWERNDWNWGDSQLRTQITIQGNEPVNFNRYVKVPDEWYREEEKKSSGWKETVLKVASEWSSLVLTTIMVVAFIYLLRADHIPWRSGFLIALAPTALNLVEKLNNLPWFYSGYSTTKPLNHFLMQKISGDLVSLFYSWASNGVTLSVTFGLLAWAFGWKLGLLRWPKWDWTTLRRSLPDFLSLLLISLALLWVTDYFQSWLTAVTAEKPSLSIDYPSVNRAVPWLAVLIDAIQSGYSTVIRYACVASVAVIVHRRMPWLVWTFLLLYPLYSALHADKVQEGIRQAAMGEFHWMLAIFLVWKLWRFDASMIFLVTALTSLLPELQLYYDKGGPAYRSQAWPLAIAAVALIFLAWWLRPAPLEPAIAGDSQKPSDSPSHA